MDVALVGKLLLWLAHVIPTGTKSMPVQGALLLLVLLFVHIIRINFVVFVGSRMCTMTTVLYQQEQQQQTTLPNDIMCMYRWPCQYRSRLGNYRNWYCHIGCVSIFPSSSSSSPVDVAPQPATTTTVPRHTEANYLKIPQRTCGWTILVEY